MSRRRPPIRGAVLFSGGAAERLAGVTASKTPGAASGGTPDASAVFGRAGASSAVQVLGPVEIAVRDSGQAAFRDPAEEVVGG